MKYRPPYRTTVYIAREIEIEVDVEVYNHDGEGPEAEIEDWKLPEIADLTDDEADYACETAIENWKDAKLAREID